MAVESRGTDAADQVLRRAFAVWHKRTLGLAAGAVAALMVALVTAFHVVVQPPTAPNLELLSQYFYGYSVSWAGVAIGGWWSFVAGFVAGWFAAFVVNFCLATWLLVIKARADLAQTSDFLDHI